MCPFWGRTAIRCIWCSRRALCVAVWHSRSDAELIPKPLPPAFFLCRLFFKYSFVIQTKKPSGPESARIRWACLRQRLYNSGGGSARPKNPPPSFPFRNRGQNRHHPLPPSPHPFSPPPPPPP